MKYNKTYQPRKSAIALAVTASLGGAILPNTALSDIYVWGDLAQLDPSSTTVCADAVAAGAVPADLFFTMLASDGAALANTSLSIKVNRFHTPLCGTLEYNTETQSGTVQISAFDFFAGTLPAVAAGITIDKVPGPGPLDDGSGNLMLANMLFNWNGTNGIPVSISWEAGVLLNEMDNSPTTFSLADDGNGTNNLSVGSPISITQTGTSPLDC